MPVCEPTIGSLRFETAVDFVAILPYRTNNEREVKCFENDLSILTATVRFFGRSSGHT